MEKPVIKFWKTSDKYGFLSNFYHSPILWATKYYPTVEHLFQARKHHGNLHDKIRLAKTPKEAKALAWSEPMSYTVEEWNNLRDRFMLECLWHKFKSDPMRTKLLDTYTAHLIEDSPVDYYWGIGKNGKGKNMLGLLLMEVREILLSDGYEPSIPEFYKYLKASEHAQIHSR